MNIETYRPSREIYTFRYCTGATNA